MAGSTAAAPSDDGLNAESAAARTSLRPARDFARLSLGYWSGGGAVRAWLLSFGVLGLVIADILVQVGINRWNGLFFDALERKDTTTVLYAVQLILAIAVAAAASGAAFVHCRTRLQVEWRQWLTQRLIGCWLADRRFYQLSIAGDPAKNPEYRIADDIRMAIEPLVDFVTGLVGSLISAVTFDGDERQSLGRALADVVRRWVSVISRESKMTWHPELLHPEADLPRQAAPEESALRIRNRCYGWRRDGAALWIDGPLRLMD